LGTIASIAIASIARQIEDELIEAVAIHAWPSGSVGDRLQAGAAFLRFVAIRTAMRESHHVSMFRFCRRANQSAGWLPSLKTGA
jgi:hypothetical protein